MTDGAGAAPPAGGGASKSSAAKTWAKRLLALALLAFVAWSLPYRDTLQWKPPAGEPLSVQGEIVGDWKLDAVGFRLSEGAPVDPAWPAELRAAWERGEPAAVDRAVERSGEPPAFHWEPGMRRAFSSADPAWVAAGLALLAAALLGAITRWWRLLLLVGCPTSWGNTLRLTFLGLFFNLVMPGMTGGDFVKAVIVVRENPGARAQALVSVAMDRILGLLVLLVMCGVVVLLVGDAFAALRSPVLIALAVGVGGALAYVNPHVRRLVRFDAVLSRLPLGEKLKQMDSAVQAYARHPTELAIAVGCSLWNHACVIFGVWALGQGFGLGDQVDVLEWFAIVPIANIAAAVPLFPGGWGIGEFAYRLLFELIGEPPALGVAVSAAFRLCQVVLSLFGGLFLLAPKNRAELDRIEATA